MLRRFSKIIQNKLLLSKNWMHHLLEEGFFNSLLHKMILTMTIKTSSTISNGAPLKISETINLNKHSKHPNSNSQPTFWNRLSFWWSHQAKTNKTTTDTCSHHMVCCRQQNSKSHLVLPPQGNIHHQTQELKNRRASPCSLWLQTVRGVRTARKRQIKCSSQVAS